MRPLPLCSLVLALLLAPLASGCGEDATKGGGTGAAGGTGGEGGEGGGAGGGGGSGGATTECLETCPPGRKCFDGDACVVDLDPGDAKTEQASVDFEAIWRFVDEEYGAFPAKTVDWLDARSRYRDQLESAATELEARWRIMQAVSEVSDGHTAAYHPDICAADPGFSFGHSNVGACVTRASDKIVVYRSHVDGLAVGDEVLGFDGRTTAQALSDLERQPRCFIGASTAAQRRDQGVDGLMFRAMTDQVVTVRRAASSAEEDVALAPGQPWLKCDGRIGLPGLEDHGFGVRSRVLESNVLYVDLRMFGARVGDQFVIEPVIAALRERFEDAAGRAGLVLDLRSNPGGSPLVYLALASWVFDEATDLFQCQSKIGKAHDAHGAPWKMASTPDPSLSYAGPLAVLLNSRTFSAGDFTSAYLHLTGRAATFGEPSGGGFGNGNTEALAGWTVGYNDILCSDLQGNHLEGHPPEVDFEVTYTVEDVIAGVDTVIASAESWVLAQDP